jgi:glycosyltransferase involved in cell wall biosynthesis
MRKAQDVPRARIPGLSEPTYSVVIPARNAERSLPRVLAALARQEPAPLEVIVVDDASTDGTAAVAAAHGARVVSTEGRRFAGGARNTGWEAARGDLVVFLDSDAVPTPSWGAGLVRAATEFPGAIVGCARRFTAPTAWGWVARLQVETPYLPRGEPWDTVFVSSFCMAVPRGLDLRWDENYGAEDAFFSADALAAGVRLVFDPRIVATHEHERGTFAELRAQQQRLAWGMARAARAGLLSRRRGLLVRVPLPYFLLLRLPGIYRRLDGEPELRRRFLRLLPRLAVAEWTLGWSALGYAIRPPAGRGGSQPLFT